MPLRYSEFSKQQISKLTESLPHAVLLEGVNGVGLKSAAEMIAGKNLVNIVQPTDGEGAIDLSKKGTIRISQIRDLITQTRDRLTSRRVYIVDEADKMSHQSQAAFLKSLEEPVAHVHFILTSHTPYKLLPTILSRVQRIRLKPISSEETRQFIARLSLPETITPAQMQFVADGRPAEIMRLIEQKDTLASRIQCMEDARAFLSGNTELKVVTLTKYANDRTKCLLFLESVEQILRFSIQKHPSLALADAMDRLADAYDAIAANSTIRLQLMYLVL